MWYNLNSLSKIVTSSFLMDNLTQQSVVAEVRTFVCSNFRVTRRVERTAHAAKIEDKKTKSNYLFVDLA